MFSKKWRIFGVLSLVAALLWRFTNDEIVPTENYVIASMKQTGYNAEMHYTTTDDGYILGLQRITGRLSNDSVTKQPLKKLGPVLFVHGLESSAADWIYYHGKNSLPFLLFDKGYDVWLGNMRGTPSSNNHSILNIDRDRKIYWNFSFHEIGHYDLPAMIDYILNSTTSKNITYVGMSQGEASFLILTSTRPEYNSKIRLALLTAASSHLKHSDNVVYKTLGRYWSTLQILADTVGLYSVPGRNIMRKICVYDVFSTFCQKLIDPLMGYANNEQFELEIVSKYFQMHPTKSSFKQLIHYLQFYDKGIFRMFDHGSTENLKAYGSGNPPEYDLTRITVPVAYFWGENDCWSRPKDIEEVTKKLSNVVLNYRIPDRFFNHMDVLMAKDVKKLLYDKMIETMEESGA